MHSLALWLDAHANPEWRQLLSFHSTWVAMFWFLFYGAFLSQSIIWELLSGSGLQVESCMESREKR